MEKRLKNLEIELKSLKIKVNEIYEWMELTQNRTLEKLSQQLIEQKRMLNKLIKNYEK